MRKELRELHQHLGTTFIYVTHDQEEALSLSDSIAVMRADRVQQCGSPREVYDHPADRFVASFFGRPPMNFLEGELSASGDEALVQVVGRRLRVEGIARISAKTGPIIVGVHPEDVRVNRESLDESWPAQVSLLELHGGQVYLELEIDGVRATAVERADAGFRAGEQIWASVAPERLHFFDAQSGIRLALEASESRGAI